MQAGRAIGQPGSLRRIDCVNVLITRPASPGVNVLLVWNADWRPPGWSLPGGSRECGESLIDAAVREVLEETGLQVSVRSLVDVHEKIGLGGRVHLVVFTFTAVPVGGSLLCSGQGEPEAGGVSAARWFPLDEAHSIPKVSRILDLVHLDSVGARCTCDNLVASRIRKNSVKA